MDLRTFTYWMSKPKNRCLDADQARTQWEEKLAAPGAILDSLGPCEKCLGNFANQLAWLGVVGRPVSVSSGCMGMVQVRCTSL
eukprot:146491-Alexandrium_andersonii.AAC.1